MFNRQQDLKARARDALRNINNRSEIQFRLWEADLEDLDDQDLASPPSQPQMGQVFCPPATSPASRARASRRKARQAHRPRQAAPALADMYPPFYAGQQVLILGRLPDFDTSTIFIVNEVFTRHTSTMIKIPWTPQAPYPVVELSQSRGGEDQDVLVLPLNGLVPLPEYLEKSRHRKRMFVWQEEVDWDGKLYRWRRYVDKYLAVWADNEQFVMDSRSTEVEYPVVWLIVQWHDRLGRGLRETAKLSANELKLADKEEWARELGRRQQKAEKKTIGELVDDTAEQEGPCDGGDQNDGQTGEKGAQGEEQKQIRDDDGAAAALDEIIESLETKDLFVEILREHGLLASGLQGEWKSSPET